MFTWTGPCRELRLAGGEGGVERHHDPRHVRRGEAELLGDRVGRRALEALPVGGVVVDDVHGVVEGDEAGGERGPVKNDGGDYQSDDD